MALVRCRVHGKLDGKTHKYVRSVEPIGYPDKTSTICGRKDCENPGLIWLDEHDEREYRNGQRIFSVPNHAVQVRAQ